MVFKDRGTPLNIKAGTLVAVFLHKYQGQIPSIKSLRSSTAKGDARPGKTPPHPGIFLHFQSRRFLKDLWRISTGAVRSGLIEMQLSQERRIRREEAQIEAEREGDGADVESC